MRIIKLNFRFRCGCNPVSVNWVSPLFHNVLLYLRTLCIYWSLVRRRVTCNLRLTSFQLCATFLNMAKYFKTVRYSCGSVAVKYIFSIYLCSVLNLELSSCIGNYTFWGLYGIKSFSPAQPGERIYLKRPQNVPTKQ